MLKSLNEMDPCIFHTLFQPESYLLNFFKKEFGWNSGKTVSNLPFCIIFFMALIDKRSLLLRPTSRNQWNKIGT
jgi:hypothetical protein